MVVVGTMLPYEEGRLPSWLPAATACPAPTCATACLPAPLAALCALVPIIAHVVQKDTSCRVRCSGPFSHVGSDVGFLSAFFPTGLNQNPLLPRQSSTCGPLLPHHPPPPVPLLPHRRAASSQVAAILERDACYCLITCYFLVTSSPATA